MENPIKGLVKRFDSTPITSLAGSQPAQAESKSLFLSMLLRKAKPAASCLGVGVLALFPLSAVEAQERSTKRRPVAATYEIRLESRKFTPKPGIRPDLRSRIKRVISQASPGNARAHIMLQLQSAPEAADRERLAKQGITLLDPVNRLAWYAAVTPSGADALANAKSVRWADLLKPEDKLAKALQKNAPVLPYQLRPENRIAYSVLFHKDVSADEVLAFARRADIQLEAFDAKAFPVVRAVVLSIPRGGLMTLAEAHIVSWIEPSPAPDEDHNRLNAQPLSNVDDVQAAPFNLNGTGVAVGLWEAGDTVFAGHLDLTPRVIVEAGQAATNDDHATHVAGTIGSSGANIVNAEGMAPNVTIASWDATADAAEMTNAATSPGGVGNPTPIQISSHSYGSVIGWSGAVFNNNQNLFGLYNNQSQGFDNVIFQTGLIVMKSAGNDRNDAPPAPVPGQPSDCFQGALGVAADCIDPRGSAKNVITVGAMNGAAAITNFSSFGPTDDGRIKPDLMAHGFNLLSLASNSFFSDGNGDGIDDVPNSTTANTTMSGTSMSTPVLSGIASLVLQEANTRNITMSPAAMKALLIQTARDVQGIGQSNPGPDYATGWGIADAEAAVNLLRQSGLAQATLNDTGIGNAWTSTFFVPAGQAEVHLTLVWDDPAGVPAGQILINDLDLRLIAPDATVFTPWTLIPATPAVAAVRNGGNDAVNNVEQVSVLGPMAGVWTVQVSANAGNLPQAPQAFAVAGLLPHSDVVLVMDRSGSMALPSGTPGVNKLEALQSSANEFIDLLDLGGGHRLSLVQFEENLVPFVPPFDLQSLSPGNVGNAHAAANSMVFGGWTNIIAGVNEASTQLGAVAAPSPRQAIVVFSDGQHNRPIGSDLNDINATVQAGNDRFYSIGFGTDVDDAILSNVANNNGGIHVNEQGLSPIQLSKYFLTVGALVHDMTVLADPTYQLSAGQSAQMSVNLSKLDQFVTFAVNWTGEQAGNVRLVLQGPDKRCRISLKDHKGLRVRKGDRYILVRVELPYYCKGQKMHEGAWTIRVSPDDFVGRGKETVDIMVLGDSRLKFDARTSRGGNERQLLLTASLLQDGKPLSKPGQALLKAHILAPRRATGDSERQDGVKRVGALGKQQPFVKEPRPRIVQLHDDGRTGDQKAGDGIFTAVLDTYDMEPGLLQARLVATFQNGNLKLTREATTSFHVKR
ncbi:MAG: S8 family serine peptidase [Acidobacteriota bacterium]